jgi:hypothetical protein
MSGIDEQLSYEHLGLAEIIALEYSNIPRSNVDDAMSEAHQSVVASSRILRSTKRKFHTLCCARHPKRAQTATGPIFRSASYVSPTRLKYSIAYPNSDYFGQ